MDLLVKQYVGQLPAIVSLPPGHKTKEGLWPILCFLHGSKEAAPCEMREALTRHGPLHDASSRRVIETHIIVAPQLPQPGGDVWWKYGEMVQYIVAALKGDYRVDPDRTYLTGFSYGGNGVFDIGHGDFWAALWPVDPTRLPRERPSQPVWLSLGDHSRVCYLEFLKSNNFKPVAADPGNDFVYVDEGEDHVESAKLAYRDENDRVFNWLSSKHRRILASPSQARLRN